MLIKVGKRQFSNFLSEQEETWDKAQAPQLTSFESEIAVSIQHSQISVQYAGGSYSSGLVKSVASTLIANLFYLELYSVPSFYTSPQVCDVYVRCRIEPGNALLDLLIGFQRQNAYLSYRGDAIRYRTVPLCNGKAVQVCQEGKPFSMRIQMSVISLESSLDVRVKLGNNESPYSISNCPYRLDQLVYDQGLNRIFNQSKLPLRQGHAEKSQDVKDKVPKLQETLRNFIEEVNRLR